MTARRCLWRAWVMSGVLVLVVASAPRAFAQEGRQGEARSVEARVKALAARLARYAATLPKEKRMGHGPLAEAALAVRKAAASARWAGRYYGGNVGGEAVAAAEKAVAALENPRAAETPRVGFQERAYLSEIDGNPEPYLLYVPTKYDAKREWPLLVFLHGYASDLDVNNWKDYMYSPTLERVCEEEGVILLLPYGRSNTEFMGIGESDVLRAIRCVRGEYRVDPRRIIMSGISMGGSGAYTIACHHPDLFAQVVAISGRIDYYLWMRVPRQLLPRFKQIQMDADYARELLPNLGHVPVLIFHGGRDHLVAIAQSRLTHKLLTDLGQSSRYVEFAWAGHNDIYSATFLHERFREVLRSARAVVKPRKVQFRTFTTKYASAYWATIEEIRVWGDQAEVIAQVVRENQIAIKCRNVSALRLGPDIPGVTDVKAVRVIVNGQAVKPVAAAEGTLRITLTAAAGKGKRALRKRVGLCGPIREAYDAPFVIVYPAPQTAETEVDRKNAARLAREWSAYAQGNARMLPDARVTDAHVRQFNLVLCGSPATNKVLQRMSNKLPVRMEANEYVVGPHRFPLKDNGMQLIYPNPLNPKRYVLVVHGAAWGSELQRNHKLDFLPDFIVYSHRTDLDGTMFPTNQFLCAGYFDNYWRLSEDSTWLGRTHQGVQVEEQPQGREF